MGSFKSFSSKCGMAVIVVLLNAPMLFSSPTASISLEPRKITVGDPIEIVIDVTADDNALIIWPTEEQFAPAEIISVDTLETTGNSHSIRYMVSLYKPELTELPELPVVAKYDNRMDSVMVFLGDVEVVSVIAPEDSLSDLRDIRPPVKLGWTWQEIMPFVIIGIAVILLGVLGLYFWRRYKRKIGDIPEYIPPLPPAYDEAMRLLEDLRVRRLWQDGYIKEYYSELTEIIKRYMDGRFHFDAPEMTTYELMLVQKKWSKNEKEAALIKKIITCADIVKFAKFNPTREDHSSCMDAGFEYVKLTKPLFEEHAIVEKNDNEKPVAVENE